MVSLQTAYLVRGSQELSKTLLEHSTRTCRPITCSPPAEMRTRNSRLLISVSSVSFISEATCLSSAHAREIVTMGSMLRFSQKLQWKAVQYIEHPQNIQGMSFHDCANFLVRVVADSKFSSYSMYTPFVPRTGQVLQQLLQTCRQIKENREEILSFLW